MDAEKLKKDIFKKVKEYYQLTKKTLPKNKVPASGKVYDENELINLVDASLKGWWTDAEYVENFEKKLSNFLEVKYTIACNSGSSANLLAFASLTSHLIPEEKRIKPGDEIITTAACFPTTVNPIILYKCVPVFLDIEIGTYNIDTKLLEEAITDKTKAIFLAHTLGNPFNLKKVLEIAKKYDLWVIEDNCDALGSKYDNKYTGTFGHISTLSFYPAHHITTAEGGAVLTRDPLLSKIIRSIKDWGRDCWCKTGHDNTCGKRFKWKLGNLPFGYDHKYIYSHIGYNLKMTDLQAAIGLAQIDKLDYFIKKRKENFNYLYKGLKKFEDALILPEATENSEPSWFGFPISIKEDTRIKRKELINYLEKNGISTRLLFGGNITKQPYFINNKIKYRVVGDLKNTDFVMNNSFWVGVYPALNKEHLDYIINKFDYFVNQHE